MEAKLKTLRAEVKSQELLVTWWFGLLLMVMEILR